MSIKLTDTELLLLSAASQREDHYLTLPSGARLASVKKTAAKLLTAGLVREVRARKYAPVWRRDESDDQAFALKLTAAGLKAIAAGLDAGDEEAQRKTQGDEVVKLEQMAREIDGADAVPGPESSGELSKPHTPRSGTKIGAVIEMLGRNAGATVDELVAATGWLPHTTRAVLTGLRKRGFEIGRRKAPDQRAGAYVIAEQNGAAQG